MRYKRWTERNLYLRPQPFASNSHSMCHNTTLIIYLSLAVLNMEWSIVGIYSGVRFYSRFATCQHDIGCVRWLGYGQGMIELFVAPPPEAQDRWLVMWNVSHGVWISIRSIGPLHVLLIRSSLRTFSQTHSTLTSFRGPLGVVKAHHIRFVISE